MVFEVITSVEKIKSSPWKFMFYVFLASSLSIFISYFIHSEISSLLSLFFVILAVFPSFYRLIIKEEKILEETEIANPLTALLYRNKLIILLYSYLFLGIVLSYCIWFIFLPENISLTVFKYQLSVLENISGYAVNASAFETIFLNNFKVATLAFLLSFLFGTGALFIVSWNASVVGVFLGVFGKEMVSGNKMLAPFYAIFIGGSSIALHGIPEIIAYFISGIAGGVLSVGIFNKTYRRRIIKDSLYFYVFSLAFLFIGALIESFL